MLQAVKNLIDIAQGEIGYQEKKTNAYLDDKNKNAGYNNYTKYGAWAGCNGQSWCDAFVSWCAEMSGNADVVGRFVYCPSHVAFFASQGRYYKRLDQNGDRYTPVPGDIIFFDDGSRVSASNPYYNAGHVGIVVGCDSGIVTTIEGNTSGSTADYNGGGVYRKTYSVNSNYILGYGHPNYAGDAELVIPPEVTFTDEWTDESDHIGDTFTYNVAKGWEWYYNGSTDEYVYQTTECTGTPIGCLNPWETCVCYGKINDAYLVAYSLDGTKHVKTGFVKYSGETDF